MVASSAPRRGDAVDGVPALRAAGVVKRYGGLHALRGVDLEVPTGARVGIVGPNGSGKTTFLNVISGFTPITAGEIHVDGHRVTGAPADRIVRRGVSRTFQNLRLWSGLTVLENLRLGQYRLRSGLAPWDRAARRALDDELDAAIERLGLAAEAFLPVAGLAYGVQKRVELGRALVARPSIVLLDEPFAGMGSEEATALLELVTGGDEGAGRTVIVIEHNVRVLVAAMDRLVVLDEGSLLADGAPEDVVADPAVRAAYLGPGWDEPVSPETEVGA